MPKLTMSVKRPPLAAVIAPSRTASANASILRRSAQDIRHDVAPAGEHRRAGKIAQSHMQRRAVLGDVDGGAGKQRGATRFDLRGAGEVDQ